MKPKANEKRREKVEGEREEPYWKKAGCCCLRRLCFAHKRNTRSNRSSRFKMLLILFLATWLPQVIDADASFSVLVPPHPISARAGSSVTLPCWLSPALDAESLEIRWHRSPSFKITILHYREGQLQPVSQAPQFSGRAFLGTRRPESRGLKEGDVSLRLENVTVEDEGEFQCYVSSELHYDKQRVVLNVTVTGTPPVLSVRQTDGGFLNASCASSGWHPKPKITWSDSQGTSSLSPGGLRYSPEGKGMVSVFSWIQVPAADAGWLSCSVSLSEWEKMEGRAGLWRTLPKSSPDTGDSSGQWRQAFIALLCLVLLAIFIIIITLWLMRKKRRVEHPVEHAEKESLLQPEPKKESSPKVIDLDELRKEKVNIILDEDTAHQNVVLTKDGKRVRDSDESQGRNTSEKRFTRHGLVLGKEGFTSGCAYWEVGLYNKDVGLKESWSVGVVSESASRDCDVLTPNEGYWVLSLDNGLLVNNVCDISLSETQNPQSLGVFLDYDKNMISFYNVEERTHILTLFTRFREKVYPLFGPGMGDKAPLVIQPIPDVIPYANVCTAENSNDNLHTSLPITEDELCTTAQYSETIAPS